MEGRARAAAVHAAAGRVLGAAGLGARPAAARAVPRHAARGADASARRARHVRARGGAQAAHGQHGASLCSFTSLLSNLMALSLHLSQLNVLYKSFFFIRLFI